MADLRLQGLSKRFGDVQAVRDLNLDVASGEFIVLLGPSGAGKTTTLRLVAGLEKPDAGTVHIGGRDVTRARAGAARRDLRVPAVLAVPAPERVRQPGVPAALADAAHARGRGAAQGRPRWRSMLRIDDKLANPATKLSGGQMQRVAIGRALVREPAVTLMDEPLSSLDAKLRNDLRLELKRIQQDLGATHAVRHARPDRGDDAGHPHRRARPRRAGAGRHAAADLPRPGEQLRRRAPGLAAHQPAAARRGRQPAGAARPRPPSACGPTARGCAWPTATTAATRRRWCAASSTWATRRTCTSRSAARQRRDRADRAVPRRQRPGARPRGVGRVHARRCSSTPPASASRPEPGSPTMELQHRSSTACTQTLIDHVEELTALDAAIGDGDHGLNMKRGALAIQAKLRRAGEPVAERGAEDDGHDLHVHHRRLVGPGVRHAAGHAGQGAAAAAGGAPTWRARSPPASRR